MLGNHLNDIEDIQTEIILKDYIPLHKGNYNIMAGAGGVGKSQVSLKMLVHFLRANPNEKAVAIFTEDTKKEIITRLESIISVLGGISLNEVLDRTFFKTLDNHDGKVFCNKINKQNILNQEYMTQFITNARFHKIGLVILDPLEAFHSGLAENDAEDMKFLTVEVFQKLGVEIGCAVLVLHHTSKGASSGARGSAVITNKGRIAYNLRKVEEEDKDLGITRVKKGWEDCVLLSTIKDNHYIARYCDTIVKENGKLRLPVGAVNNNNPINEIEFDGMEMLYD